MFLLGQALTDLGLYRRALLFEPPWENSLMLDSPGGHASGLKAEYIHGVLEIGSLTRPLGEYFAPPLSNQSARFVSLSCRESRVLSGGCNPMQWLYILVASWIV